ncbi:phage terminase large subunit, partial [Arthrospira platensis SPKY2]
LYGGAAGGGKSYSMVIDPLRYAHLKGHNAVIIRKTMPELNELIDTSRELYPIAFPGAKYRETDHVWTFPSGAHIRFGHLDRPADKFKYQGKAFSYIGFDELSQHQTDEGFRYLQSRLRRTNQEIHPYIRATANPGSQWVYDMFIAPQEPGKPFIMKGTENNDRPIT